PVPISRSQARADFCCALQNAPCAFNLQVRGGRIVSVDCAPLEPRFLLCTLNEDPWMNLIREGVEACAHDIKTELTCAMGTAQILEINENLDVQCMEKLVRLRRFCQSAAVMADQLCRDMRLLDPSREGQEVATDFDTTLQGIYEDCKLLAQDKGIAMSLSCLKKPLFVGVGEQKLRRILMNFISNALKFTPPGGTIDLCLRRKGSRDCFFAEMEIRDSGVGIPADRLPKQGHRYAPRSGIPGEGSGLGLSIVQTMVRSLRGQLRFESEPGKGTTIRLSFPERPDPGRHQHERS
nr:HAMP domain-containing sensor histidine kinase [Clostridia bacterium]